LNHVCVCLFSPQLASWPPGLLGAQTTRAPFALRFDEFNGQPGILFPDGNKWTKVNGGTPDRRPPNETLKAD